MKGSDTMMEEGLTRRCDWPDCPASYQADSGPAVPEVVKPQQDQVGEERDPGTGGTGSTAWEEFHAATVISGRFEDWPVTQTRLYAALGLANEAGEAAGEMKKALRDDAGEITPQRRQAVIDEVGDVLWYAARLLESVDATLADAAEANIAKVRHRLATGTLSGHDR